MAEYIEREALIALLKADMEFCDSELGDSPFSKGAQTGINAGISYATVLPAADVVEVKRGRWIPTPEYDSCWCLCCKKQYTGFFASYWNFCPNCGSRMGGD